MKASIFPLLLLAAASPSGAPGPDLLNWPACPPGLSYSNPADPKPAHFQTSPVAPPGGTCSLDVVTGSIFVPASDSAGGVEFDTPGETAGDTYTLAFDLQWVSGDDPWFVSNETVGDGDVNGLVFDVPFPGDYCWHHVEWTAPLGANGPKDYLYVYQGHTAADPTPVLEEMRIADMTLREAAPGAPNGLTVDDGKDHWGWGDDCCDRHHHHEHD